MRSVTVDDNGIAIANKYGARRKSGRNFLLKQHGVKITEDSGEHRINLTKWVYGLLIYHRFLLCIALGKYILNKVKHSF